MATAILTAIYGDYDPLRPLPANHGFDEAICVTDNPDLVAEGWNVLYQPEDLPPRLASKIPKMMPFNFVKTEFAVWLDASFQIVGDGFRDFCVESLGDKDIIVWDHPDRHMRPDVFAEGAFSRHMQKYRDEKIEAQVAHYASEGLPPASGLYACGTIAWRNVEAARGFGCAWYQENVNWTIQDQISFPYLVWKLQPNFGVFPAHEYENPYLKWWKHERDS